MKKPLQANAKRILFLSLALFIIGGLILYSASSVQSFKIFGNPDSLFLHQLGVGGVIGLTGLLLASKIHYKIWQKYSSWIILVAALLLLAVFLPPLGFTSGGATRWLAIGPFNFQPGEIAKFAAVVYASSWLAKHKLAKSSIFEGILPMISICLVLSALLLKQPDMGTAITLIGSVGFIVLATGISWKNIFLLCLIGLLSGALVIQLAPYRADRLSSFLNPGKDPLGSGYQINQSLLAIGSGGIWGYGYGLSRQKHNYLPEAIGDSIFAVASEELGLVRITLILTLFVLWILVGLKIAGMAPDVFSKLLATGLTSMIGLQALVNLSASMGILPLTGIPLPFFSYGSSALVITLVSSGILVNISKHSKEF